MVLKSQRLRLVLKTLLFGYLLYLARGNTPSFFVVSAFITFASLLYFRPVFNNLTYLRSFIFLLGLIFVIPNFSSGLYNILINIFFIIIFYIILALKEFVLVKRTWWHHVSTISLLYLAVFVTSFKANPDNFINLSVVLALSSLMLMSEYVYVSLEIQTKKSLLVSAIFSFLIFQGFWIASILPLGFIGAANLVALGIFMFLDLATNFYTHKLDWRLIWQRLILFSVLAATLLAGFKWRL